MLADVDRLADRAGDADAARSLTAAHLTHIRDQLRRAAEEDEASR